MPDRSDPADDAIARHLVLRGDDLPGRDWTPHHIDLTDGTPAIDPDDESFEGFPEHHVTAAATSARFTRGDAVAWSVAWLLDGADAAAVAFDRLADEAFASAFVRSAMPFESEGTAAVLGRDPTPSAPVVGVEHAVRHRTRLTAADRSGLVVVHLDLLALGGGRTASLVILGQSGEPFPDQAVAALAGRVSDRLHLVP